MENHVAELEKRLATFEQKKAQLASLHDQLIPIIHRPGWTTLAEVSLVGITMDSLEFHVDSIARAINVANAQPNSQGVANVNPIFTWVRLAQRIPVRIHIDAVPPEVILAAGMTATVEIHDRGRAPAK